MQRLETENYNTKEYYNNALLNHFNESGLDYDDSWRIQLLAKKYQGGKLLDVGCGISPLCVLITRTPDYESPEAYGIDFADKLIEKLQERFPSVHYSVGDFNALPFEDEFFNYVVLGEILEHSEEPQKVIDEAFRVLKKGSFLALSTPCNERKETHDSAQHIWSFSPEDIIQMIGKEKIVNMQVITNNIICHARK